MTSKPDSSALSSTEIDTHEARGVLRVRAREAIAKQPARTVTILSSLLAAQDELGYLPAEAIDEVASRMTASANAVWGIASFYPNFRFTPPNRHKIELCWGPTCHVLGAQQVLQGLLPHLGLDNEGETGDGVISFKLNTCLGVCAHGPAMSFDEELSGHMSLDKAIRLTERIKAEDEEILHAGLMLAEGERSKAEIVAKAAVRTAERAAMAEVAAAEAAAKLAEEEEARAKAEEEAKAQAEAIAKAEAIVKAEAEKAAKVAGDAAALDAGESAEVAVVEEEPQPVDDAESPSDSLPSDEAPAVTDEAPDTTGTEPIATDEPANGDSPVGESPIDDAPTDESSEETKDD
jgi:NADH:ubiquinone oxidoreductase subunit E